MFFRHFRNLHTYVLSLGHYLNIKKIYFYTVSRFVIALQKWIYERHDLKWVCAIIFSYFFHEFIKVINVYFY